MIKMSEKKRLFKVILASVGLNLSLLLFIPWKLGLYTGCWLAQLEGVSLQSGRVMGLTPAGTNT